MVATHPVDAEDALPGGQQLRAEPHVDGPEDLAVDDPAQAVAGLVDAQRPTWQRASSVPAWFPPGVARLYIASRVGADVIAYRRSRVRWSTSPVTGIPRLAWKPRTASVVVAS